MKVLALMLNGLLHVVYLGFMVSPDDVTEGPEGGMALPPPPPPLGGLLNSESVGGGGGPD